MSLVLVDKKLSVVTVNLNNVEGLRKTMHSVLSQSIFSQIEYIVIDGGSKDGSQEEIKKVESSLAYWCSEKDAGVYNAMNKGIVKSTGEYILFLNSGDYFISNTIAEEALSSSDADIIYGFVDSPIGIQTSPEKITVSTLVKISLHHQATFIRRSLFDQYGLYSEDNRFESDWEFFLKTILVEKVSTSCLGRPVSYFEMGGLSSNERLDEEKQREKLKVVQRVLPEIAVLYQDYLRLNTEVRMWRRKSLGVFFKIAAFLDESAIARFLKKLNRR